MTDDPEFGSGPWPLPPIVDPAELKKVVVDAVQPFLPTTKVRTLLDVNEQRLHVQMTVARTAASYEEVRDAIFRNRAYRMNMKN